MAIFTCCHFFLNAPHSFEFLFFIFYFFILHHFFKIKTTACIPTYIMFSKIGFP